MDFQIPQFISREPTIVASLTFRQFMTLTVAFLAIFMTFFMLKNLFLFTIIATLIATTAIVFSFIRIGGQSFPVFFRNFIFYFLKPRIYVWRKKGVSNVMAKQETGQVRISDANEGEEEKKKISLSRESHLNKLWTKIETKRIGGEQ